MPEAKPTDTSKYWPCACVKRDRDGNWTHIKLNHPSLKRCKVCGALKSGAIPTNVGR
jgi:hypothetical protein